MSHEERTRGYWSMPLPLDGRLLSHLPDEWVVLAKGKCRWCRGPAYSPRATWCGYEPSKCYQVVFAWWWSAKPIRRAVFRRDGFTCRACGVAPTQVVAGRVVPMLSRLHSDHIVPIARGGKTTWENLQTLCASCNLRKGARIESTTEVTL